MVDVTIATAFMTLLEARRSTRRLAPGRFHPKLIENLAEATSLIPSSFNTQPWRVVVLHERNSEFWDFVVETIQVRLDGDREARYLSRAQRMREGGMTLLIFEEIGLSAPNEHVSTEDARDFASQSFGMLQLALWLILTAHGLATSPQHWDFLLRDVVSNFSGLPEEGFRLITFMPVGYPAESPVQRQKNRDRLLLECFQSESS